MRTIKAFSNRIYRGYKNYLHYRQSCLVGDIEKKTLHNITAGVTLSKAEKEELKDKWGRIIKHLSLGYPFYAGIKALNGFNPDYLSTSYYFPRIESILNPTKYKEQLGHKSMTELILGKEFNYPKTLLRSYGGVYLDSNYNPVSDYQAARLIESSESPLIFKPAVETNQGVGIELIKTDQLKEYGSKIETRNIFRKYPDFVMQFPLSQSSETSLYNPTSLNCMRVTTLNLNGEITVCSRALKCGPKDSVVDNIGSGRRGVIVGIREDGALEEYGFYGNGDKATEHNGVNFKGKRIDHFPDLEAMALRLHAHIPNCHIIGWDLALDANNSPVLIEGNVVYPGILFEQMCSGPIFGERTEEVVEYLNSYLKFSENIQKFSRGGDK